jgi:hypothetical protein
MAKGSKASKKSGKGALGLAGIGKNLNLFIQLTSSVI